MCVQIRLTIIVVLPRSEGALMTDLAEPPAEPSADPVSSPEDDRAEEVAPLTGVAPTEDATASLEGLQGVEASQWAVSSEEEDASMVRHSLFLFVPALCSPCTFRSRFSSLIELLPPDLFRRLPFLFSCAAPPPHPSSCYPDSSFALLLY